MVQIPQRGKASWNEVEILISGNQKACCPTIESSQKQIVELGFLRTFIAENKKVLAQWARILFVKK
jgi:hypothetical protein